MTKTFVHIGCYKTGSTFLQNEIFPRLPQVCYIGGVMLTFNHRFSQLLYCEPSEFDSKGLFNEIEELRNSCPSMPMLISSEWLFGDVIARPGFNQLGIAKKLKAVVPQAEIILVIRNQADLMRSLYAQLIRAGDVHCRAKEFFRCNPAEDLDLSLLDVHRGASEVRQRATGGRTRYIDVTKKEIYPSFFDFARIIDFYKSLFNKVHVLCYEDFQKSPTDFVNRLSSIIGVPPFEIGEIDPGRRINASLKEHQVHTKRIENKLVPLISIDWARRGLAWIMSKFVRKEDFRAEIDRFYRENFKQVNMRLAQQVDLGRHSKLYLIE